MAEFYVTYDRHDHHFLAIVLASGRPEKLEFVSRESLIETMESLGHEWRLQSEVELPDDYPAISAIWLESMAERGSQKQLPKPQGSHISTLDTIT